MDKKWLVIAIAVIVLVLIAWAPWITKSYAENKVFREFEADQVGVVDGCGFSCDGCGVKDSSRALFGYSVEIEYACGLTVPGNTRTETKFVSFIGI